MCGQSGRLFVPNSRTKSLVEERRLVLTARSETTLMRTVNPRSVLPTLQTHPPRRLAHTDRSPGRSASARRAVPLPPGRVAPAGQLAHVWAAKNSRSAFAGASSQVTCLTPFLADVEVESVWIVRHAQPGNRPPSLFIRRTPGKPSSLSPRARAPSRLFGSAPSRRPGWSSRGGVVAVGSGAAA